MAEEEEALIARDVVHGGSAAGMELKELLQIDPQLACLMAVRGGNLDHRILVPTSWCELNQLIGFQTRTTRPDALTLLKLVTA